MRVILLLVLIVNIVQYTSGQNMSGNKNKVALSANEICPIKIGEVVPDVELKNIDGATVNLREIVNQKPTVLIFYRGGWCPYCNLQLADLNTIEADILQMGYQIIGISMDKPEKLKESLDKYQMNYTLLSDSKAEASIAFGLAFKVEESYNEMLKSHNLDIEDASGENHHILPVPAVYLLDQNGIIQFEYVNPDYKIRLNGEILLKAAEQYSIVQPVK